MKEFQQAAVGGFIVDAKGLVLLVKRSSKDDFLPKLWELPGGGVDFGESPQKALKREIFEEVGLDVAVGKPLAVDHYFMEVSDINGKKQKIYRVEIIFSCMINNSQKVALSHEHEEFKWVAKENLDTIAMTDFMKKAIATCFANL